MAEAHEDPTAGRKVDPRAERLKAALRANLRKRKAQERGRAEGEPGQAGRDDAPQGR